ncbi:hypothetical protein M3Y99_01684000 [Aphelenchoides fujianensis]|nr:hypothetical protein M3Y99_01684000 [Aphelenchoides fujianensis]
MRLMWLVTRSHCAAHFAKNAGFSLGEIRAQIHLPNPRTQAKEYCRLLSTVDRFFADQTVYTHTTEGFFAELSIKPTRQGKEIVGVWSQRMNAFDLSFVVVHDRK